MENQFQLVEITVVERYVIVNVNEGEIEAHQGEADLLLPSDDAVVVNVNEDEASIEDVVVNIDEGEDEARSEDVVVVNVDEGEDEARSDDANINNVKNHHLVTLLTKLLNNNINEIGFLIFQVVILLGVTVFKLGKSSGAFLFGGISVQVVLLVWRVIVLFFRRSSSSGTISGDGDEAHKKPDIWEVVYFIVGKAVLAALIYMLTSLL